MQHCNYIHIQHSAWCHCDVLKRRLIWLWRRPPSWPRRCCWAGKAWSEPHRPCQQNSHWGQGQSNPRGSETPLLRKHKNKATRNAFVTIIFIMTVNQKSISHGLVRERCKYCGSIAVRGMSWLWTTTLRIRPGLLRRTLQDQYGAIKTQLGKVITAY